MRNPKFELGEKPIYGFPTSQKIRDVGYSVRAVSSVPYKEAGAMRLPAKCDDRQTGEIHSNSY